MLNTPLEIWITAASLIVSICAFWVSWRADARGKSAARMQLFLDLRTRFLDVLDELPPEHRNPGWTATDPKERAAAIRYWHHAFDEWYITKRLNQPLMRRLWEQYYSQAILAGLRHNGMRKILFEITSTDIKHEVFWLEFRRDIDQIWAGDHPHDGTSCAGLLCNHSPANPSKEGLAKGG